MKDRPVPRNTEQASINRKGYESVIIVVVDNHVFRICHIFSKIRNFVPTIAPQSPSSIIRGLYNRPEVATVPSGLTRRKKKD
jgi:hypothetical protein